MDARIRRMRRGEAPRVLSIVKRVFTEYGLWKDHSCGMGDIERAPSSYGGGEFLVVERDGRLIGCGGLMPRRRGVAEIRRMFFLPSARGRGLGRALLERLMRTARRKGFRRLVLETSPRFQDAIGLYLRCGFDACVLDEDCCCSVVMFRSVTSRP